MKQQTPPMPLWLIVILTMIAAFGVGTGIHMYLIHSVMR